MKKIMSIIREYPAAAALCVAADALVTIRFTRLSAASDPTAMTYFIALYGAFMGVLIFSAGLSRASAKAEEKAAQKRRERRRNAIYAMREREFYNIRTNPCPSHQLIILLRISLAAYIPSRV